MSYTEYSTDEALADWTEGTSLTVAAPRDHSQDGIHTYYYSSTDKAGIVEPTRSCQVRIDTLGPVCATTKAAVKRGRTCRLCFHVYDALSTKVTTVLTVTTKSGVVKKRWSWGYGKNFAGWWWILYKCGLPRGTYYIHVYGKDLAGNAQSVAGKAVLRVT